MSDNEWPSSKNLYIPSTPRPSSLDIDPEYVDSVEAERDALKAEVLRLEGLARSKDRIIVDELKPKLKIAREALEAIGAFKPKDTYDLFPIILAKDALGRIH